MKAERRSPVQVNVLVADDHPEFRRLLINHLTISPEIVVIGEAEDGEQAVQLAGQHKPDLVLMDITMPRLNGLEATKRIKTLRPETRVIILTIHSEEAYRKAAAENGSDGFVLKERLVTTLLPTILQVMSDGKSKARSVSSQGRR